MPPSPEPGWAFVTEGHCVTSEAGWEKATHIHSFYESLLGTDSGSPRCQLDPGTPTWRRKGEGEKKEDKQKGK